MKIRSKLTMLMGSAALLFALGLASAMVLLSETRFRAIDLAMARDGVARLEAGLRGEEERLRSVAQGYAVCDETWAYARGRLPSFAELKLGTGALESAGADSVALFGPGGALLYALRGDFAPRPVPGDGSLPTKLGASADLAAIAVGGKGAAALAGGPLLYTALPILRSDRSGPPAGTLMLGRALDEVLLRDLGDRAGVEIAAIEWAGSGSAGETSFSVAPGGRAVLGRLVLASASGLPLAVVTTTTPRHLRSQGLSIIALFFGFALVLGFLLILLGRRAFDRWILSPLEGLKAALRGMGEAELDAPQEELGRLVGRRDEIGLVARVLASIKARLLEARELLRRSQEGLETRIRERTEELESANRSLGLYAKILESTSESVIVTDLEGRIVEVNEAACRMAGIGREELIGANPRVLKSGRHGNEFYAAMWRSVLGRGSWSGEIWDRAKGGEIRPRWLSINIIRDAEGKPVNYVGISSDISLAKDAERKLDRLTNYDALTGLPNRALFSDRLDRAIVRARRKSTLVALLFLDLDRFKNVNDSLGHGLGDRLLVCVADRLRSKLRDTDTICRFGGDEFTIILEDVLRRDDVTRVARAVMGAMADPFAMDDSEIYASASLGIALSPDDGTDADSLVRKADAAMYDAKEAGGGTWRYAVRGQGMDGRRRLQMEARLHVALERGEFELRYQAQTRALETLESEPSGLVGAEALIRWVPRDGGTIEPEEFIDLAEETGLIVPIGDWAIHEACRTGRRWLDEGHSVQVSVNVSLRQFADGRLAHRVRSALEESGLPPSLLKLEVTESLFARDMGRVADTIRAIRATGVTFAIDDFGTGYSSLRYLDRLPVDSLKIDKSFVQALDGGSPSGDLVAAVIAMARAFGMTSVAEGVETSRQLEGLQARGCDLIQGYLVSRPLSAADFLAFARGDGTGRRASVFRGGDERREIDA